MFTLYMHADTSPSVLRRQEYEVYVYADIVLHQLWSKTVNTFDRYESLQVIFKLWVLVWCFSQL